MDKILFYIPAAPPAPVYCVDTLRGEGIEPVSLWFNPNIHPWTEYDQRRSTLLEYGEKERVEVHILEDYGLRDFVRAVAADIDHRCAHCYTIRLGTAAEVRERARLRGVHLLAAHFPLPEPRAAQGGRRDDGEKVRRGVSLPTSAPASARDRQRLVRWGFISRNTAAASSPRRTATRKKDRSGAHALCRGMRT